MTDKTKEIGKPDFITLIAEQRKITKAESAQNLAVVLDTIQSTVAEGKKINFKGFGSFYTSRMEAREGRNPKTGEAMQIAAYNMVKFKASSKLKEICNKK